MYNQKIIHKNLFTIIGVVKIGTIYEWHKKLRANNDDWHCLIGGYNYGEFNSKTNLRPQEESLFLEILLSPNKINIGKATRLVKHILNERGVKNLSCDMSYRRFANNFQKNHYDVWTFAREGQKALVDKVLPYIPRDISQIEVGDVLIADGHRLAFNVINPFTGHPSRATIVAYQDWKSTAMVGFEIMLEENTQCIASALRNSIINLGKVPSFCYQDNGKAFKANYFIDSGLSGIFANLGIQPVFAKPYNAKAKPIERFFKEFQESFERLLPSFVGANISDKPAYLLRNEKLHKQKHNNFVPTIEQTIEMINKWLEFHYSQPCPNVKGKTIGQVLQNGRGSGVDINRLDDLMLATEIKTIHRNGIRFLKADYYNEALYGFRDRVLVKYSLFDLSKIKVFTLKGKFICEAERVMPINPLAHYIGDVKDVEDLKQRLKQQKQLERQTVQEYIKELKREKAFVPMLQVENTIEISDFQEIEFEEPPKISNIFRNKYERYEHLLAQENLSEEDAQWLKDYENTDEYRLIYEEERRVNL